MSLIDKITSERIDFRIAGMSHYCDRSGAHMAFGSDSMHHICNAFYVLREFLRGCDVQPAGDVVDTPVGPPCACRKTVGYATESNVQIRFAGHVMEYLVKNQEGVRGPWLHKWDGQAACIADTPQEYADLADAVIKWMAKNFRVVPTLVPPEE